MSAACGATADTEMAAVHTAALPAAEGVMQRVRAKAPSVLNYFLLQVCSGVVKGPEVG
jgi:hypothetical protein